MPTRVKALVQPLRDRLGDSGDAEEREIRAGLESILALADRARGDLGRGAALFAAPRSGLEEYIRLPAPVRERAIVDAAPYLGPLEAMLAQYPRSCAAVTDRRNVWIYRFHLDELEAWEQIGEKEIRKDNYGGFSGYAEQRVRGHAEAVAKRLFRSASTRLAELFRDGRFALLIVGGQQANVAGLLDEIPADLRRSVAGTITVDPGTATPADIRDRCREVVAGHERRVDEQAVAALLDAAASGGRAVLGVERCVDAANHRAIDTLLVEAGRLIPGFVCAECGWMAPKADECAVCGGALRAIPDLVDAVAEASRSDGGSVRYLTAETALSGHEIGAVIRFSIPAGDGS
jgi:peptide chain release factor subunit 1